MVTIMVTILRTFSSLTTAWQYCWWRTSDPRCKLDPPAVWWKPSWEQHWAGNQAARSCCDGRWKVVLHSRLVLNVIACFCQQFRDDLVREASYSMDVASGRVDKQNVDVCSQQSGSEECGSRRSDFTELKVPDMNGFLRRMLHSGFRTLEHE